MDLPSTLQFVQAVGVPATFAFALLWIIDRRLASLTEKIERVLTLLERISQDMATIVAGLGEKE